MNAKLLLPHRFKITGLILLLPSLVLGIYWRFLDWEFPVDVVLNKVEKSSAFKNGTLNFTDEIALTGIIVGLLLIAFSREKHEDEFINRIRLESLQWAVLVNYLLLIVAAWLIHGWSFIDVMMYNMLTVLILFITRFNFLLYRHNRDVEIN